MKVAAFPSSNFKFKNRFRDEELVHSVVISEHAGVFEVVWGHGTPENPSPHPRDGQDSRSRTDRRDLRGLSVVSRFIGKDCQTSLHLFHNSIERVEDTVCTEFFPKLVPQNLCRV